MSVNYVQIIAHAVTLYKWSNDRLIHAFLCMWIYILYWHMYDSTAKISMLFSVINIFCVLYYSLFAYGTIIGKKKMMQDKDRSTSIFITAL